MIRRNSDRARRSVWRNVAIAALVNLIPAAFSFADDPPPGYTVGDVKDFSPPAGCECGDAATANIIDFFDRHGIPDLVPDSMTPDDLMRDLHNRGALNNPDKAMEDYIKNRGLQEKLEVHGVGSGFDTIKNEITNGQLLVAGLTSGLSIRHTVTVNGFKEMGTEKQIGIKDINSPSGADFKNSSADGTDYYQVHPIGNGALEFSSYKFFTVDSLISVSPKKPKKPVVPPPPTPQTNGDAGVARSRGNSVHWDPASGMLQFTNDVITVAGGDAADSVVGAAVLPPMFELINADADAGEALFRPVDSSGVALRENEASYFHGNLSLLLYDRATNTFHADLFGLTVAGAAAGSELFDASLNATGSPFLDSIAIALDPASPSFRPLAELHLSYIPDVNLWNASDGFKGAAVMGVDAPLDNVLFITEVPEPAALPVAMLLAAGIFRRRCSNPGSAQQ